MNVRPTAFFFTKCNIDSGGVHELYSRAQDGFESTKMYAVSEVSLVALAAQFSFLFFLETELAAQSDPHVALGFL